VVDVMVGETGLGLCWTEDMRAPKWVGDVGFPFDAVWGGVVMFAREDGRVEGRDQDVWGGVLGMD